MLALVPMSEKINPIVPKWLTDLQQRSWEPEILLSGIVLLGMLRVPGLLDGLSRYFKLNVFGDLNDVDNLVAMFKVGIYWLISGLVLHLICRGIWIGMVGLSYAFPKGIQIDKLEYQEPFRGKVSRVSSIEQIVIRLEKVCSLLFSISFLLFMSLIGGYLFLFMLIIIPFAISYVFLNKGLSGTFYDLFQIYVAIIFSLGMLGLIDFLSLGYFRKYKWFAKAFWPIHRMMSVLTLSRFYRPIYYGIVTNLNRWAFFVFLVTFSVISILGSGASSFSFYDGDAFSRLELWEGREGAIAFSAFYQNQNHERPSEFAQIPSDVITGGVLRLFLIANIRKEGDILAYKPLDSLRQANPEISQANLKLKAIHAYYQLFLDGEAVVTDRWFFHYHEATGQRGYLTYISLKSVEPGTHIVQLRDPEGNPYVTIPFYRD